MISWSKSWVNMLTQINPIWFNITMLFFFIKKWSNFFQYHSFSFYFLFFTIYLQTKLLRVCFLLSLIFLIIKPKLLLIIHVSFYRCAQFLFIIVYAYSFFDFIVCTYTILPYHYNISKRCGESITAFFTFYCGLLQCYLFFKKNYLCRFYFFNIKLVKNLAL
jgi:hypothetical protein